MNRSYKEWHDDARRTKLRENILLLKVIAGVFLAMAAVMGVVNLLS